jgi:hypothetical protein
VPTSKHTATSSITYTVIAFLAKLTGTNNTWVVKIDTQWAKHTSSENQKTLSFFLVAIIYVILGAIFPWSTDGYQVIKGIDLIIDPVYSSSFNVIIKVAPVSISIIVISLIALSITAYSLLILNTNNLRILNLLFGGFILYLAFYGFQVLKLMLFDRGIIISAPISAGFIFTVLGGLIIFADGFIFLFNFLRKLLH